jgi:ferrous iron transport protein B
MILALAGNQNSGKTTLFNQLTGSNQHVGNFPGVTVEQKTGFIRPYDERHHRHRHGGHGGFRGEHFHHGGGHHGNGCHHGRAPELPRDARSVKSTTIVDLPGIYSIRPYSAEEIVTRDFILNEKPDGIINIVDATNIERNLYLTLQLIEMRVPMVLALNMMDEVRGNGGTIDVRKMSEELGIPVVPISAVKNEGIDELVDTMLQTARNKVLPRRIDFCESGPVHRCIHAVSHAVEDHAEKLGISPRFAATKIIEGDVDIIARLELDKNELDMIEHSIVEMETEHGMDRNAAMAEMRYLFIEKVCGRTVVKSRESKEHQRSVRIDKLLTNKYLAIPVFLLIMFAIFWLTFSVIGAWLSDLLSLGITALTGLVDSGLAAYGINPVVKSLVVDGVFAGVGSMLSFLPLIVVLFFFLSILEDTGYMARVAYVMDKLMRKIGLSGRSIVPMLLGFGCSVPAVMATRTLSSNRDRRMTILLTPFMSCSAKIPIYAVFTAAFFVRYRALVMIGLYVTGILIGIVVALLSNRTVFRGKPVPFVMELPNYRFPSLKTVVILMWEKAKDFLVRAFTIILLATIVIWFLQTFDLKLNVVSDSTNSLLALVGKLIAPIFRPLGFDDWRISTALITGFTAKEAVISTMGVLLGTDVSSLSAALSGLFTPLTAVSFLVFTLLYTPCVAAVATIKREFQSGPIAAGVVVTQCVVAWLAAFGAYNLFRIFV